MRLPAKTFSRPARRSIGLGAVGFLLAGVLLVGVPVRAENDEANSKGKSAEPKNEKSEKSDKTEKKPPTAEKGAQQKPPAKPPSADSSEPSKEKREKPGVDREKKGDGPPSGADKFPSKSNPKNNPKVADKSNSEDARSAETKVAEKKLDNVKPGSEKVSREGIALQFAKRHHPELAELLHQLKRGNESEYDRAIRDLYQTSEKLARIQEKTPERYDFAVNSWKLDSRIRLLSARIVMSDSPALEAELKELLRARHDLKLAELKKERDRVATRLARLDSEILALESDTDGRLQKELQVARKQLTEQASELKSKPFRKPVNDGKPDGKADSRSKGDAKSEDAKKSSAKPTKEPQSPEGSEKPALEKKREAEKAAPK